MQFPDKWKKIENDFDEKAVTLLGKDNQKSLPQFCLSDFLIIKNGMTMPKELKIHYLFISVICQLYTMTHFMKQSS